MNPKLIKSAEVTVAILLSALALFLLIVRMTHAGALWRDEAATVQLAEMPTLHDVAANFQHEAFPLPFPLLIRSYIGLFGGSDASLRCFGFVVGMLVLAVAWFNSRTFADRGPLLFLALMGCHTAFLVWGTSVRGYGLGIALILLTLGLVAKALREPTRRDAINATVAAVASVQILLNSWPLIGAIAMAAFLVFLLERKFREARWVCVCATVPVLSFLPYLKSYLGADWTIVLKFPVTISSLWEKFQGALAGDYQTIALLWETVVVLFLLKAVFFLWSARYGHTAAELRPVRFILFFVLLSIVAYGAFLKILSYATRPWYYLPLICCVAGAVDIMGGAITRMLWLRVVRIIIALALVILIQLTKNPLRDPFTNIDAVARNLEKEAAPNDLIVVNPWHYGPSFYRYYHGPTRWITSPSISEHRIHRYDLMKAKVMEDDPLSEVRSAIRETLQSYHRIWIVGGARPPEEGLPATLGRPPNSELGWAGYVSFWSIELGTFLSEHVAAGELVMAPPPNRIRAENIPLLVGRGWQD